MAVMSCNTGQGDVRLPLTCDRTKAHEALTLHEPDTDLSADSEGSHGNRAEVKELQAGCSTSSFLRTQPEMLMLTLAHRGPCLVSSYKLSSELGGQEDIIFCAAFLVIRDGIGPDCPVISSIELHLPKHTTPMAPLEGRKHHDPHPTKKMSQTNDQIPSDYRKSELRFSPARALRRPLSGQYLILSGPAQQHLPFKEVLPGTPPGQAYY